MNKVWLIGRLTRDPEVRYVSFDNSQDLKCVAKYTLAVDRRGSRTAEASADFIPCVAFGRDGEFAEKFLKKGMKIAICGRIQTGSYTNQEGQRVYTMDIIVNEQEFAERKTDSANTDRQQSSDAGGFMNIPEGVDDNLPFS